MNGLYASPSASQPLASQTVTLANPLIADNVTLFRHTVYLVVPVDAICERVSLSANASLTVQFSPQPVAITHTSSAWNRAAWHYDEGRIDVDLALPIRVYRINSTGYGQAALHRMDGDKVIDEPTLTVTTNQPIAQEFVASRFAIALSGTVVQANATVQSAMKSVSDAMQPANAAQGPQHNRAKKKAVGVEHAHQTQPHQEEILQVLYGYALDAIVVQGQPTSPRMRLMTPDNGESLWQWLEFAGVQAETRSVTVTAEQLQPALERAFAAREPGVQSLVLPLVFESDAPCQLQLHAQQFSFKRQANLLEGGELVALRFSSGQIDTLSLPLQVPDVAAEALALTFSMGKNDATAPAGGLPTIASLAKSGFRLQAGDHLAVPVELSGGAFSGGYGLPWWPLESAAKLNLTLHADQGGAPATALLATATLVMEDEAPLWLMFRWPERELQPGRYWLQLAVEDGSGLWLADNVIGQVHRHCVNGASEMLAVPQTPVYYPLHTAGGQAVAPALTASLNGAPIPFEADGAQWRARLQSLPARPWVLQVQMDRGGQVTVEEESLWY